MSETKKGPATYQTEQHDENEEDITKQSMVQYFDDEVYVEIIKYQRRLWVHGHSPAAGRLIMIKCGWQSRFPDHVHNDKQSSPSS